MKKYLAIAFFVVLLSASIGIKESFAADTWYVGEGLKEGDYFRYTLCQVDYKSCTEFEMDFWVNGKTEHGDWNLQVVVIDGNKIVTDNMEVGRAAPEPVNVSKELLPYASAYKSSIVWLSGFATRNDPKDFSAPAWGKIGSIGGMQVGPTGAKETVTVPAGTFETFVVGWHKSTDNKIWVKDNFPFPIKALTFVDVTAGTIPVQYQFELLEYGNTANPPDFLDAVSTPTTPEGQCPRDDSIVRKQANTDTNKMIIEYSYSPEHPKTGCEIKWNLDFAKSFDVNQFESDVHYDVFVVDDDGVPVRSHSNDQGRDHLFSPAGKELFSMVVKEPEGIAHYMIHVYGTGPDGVAPNTEKAGSLTIDIEIAKGTTTSPKPPVKESNPPMEIAIDIPEGAADINGEIFYDPADTYVTPGSTITWTNSDTAAHTVTSGTPTDGPDGKFDSGLFGPGKTFETILDEKGTHPYFCQVHPWMVGSITVDPTAVPEFPVSVIMIMILVVAVTVVISRFRTNVFNLKF
ncbi:MAG TPA: plastocyanin/azurin family copper-binding protein [Nitrosopumilaceae archaeon]|nr:plastocyanin/azurin family copper-binding protein [Nitrosopumilaceae archaeon]